MSKKKKLYYCEYAYGCGIRAYHSIESCQNGELQAEGYNNFRGCREATADDIYHVKSMGGRIPEL